MMRRESVARPPAAQFPDDPKLDRFAREVFARLSQQAYTTADIEDIATSATSGDVTVTSITVEGISSQIILDNTLSSEEPIILYQHTDGTFRIGRYGAADDLTIATTGAITIPVSLSVGSLTGIIKGASGALTAITAGTANQILGMDAAGTGYEYKSVLGTTNRVSVTHAAGSMTLSAPQDIHTGASPTFAGMTITGLSGPVRATTGVLSAGTIDISSETNLAVSVPISLTGDTVGLKYAAPLSLDGSNQLYIADDAVGEAKLTMNNSPSDAYVIKWNQTAGKMEWVAATTLTGSVASGAAGRLAYYPTAGTGVDDLAIGTAYQLVRANSDASGHEYATIQGTSNRVTVTAGAGTITLSAPQDLHTSASPTFSGMTLSGMTVGSVLFSGTAGLLSQDNTNLSFDNTNDVLYAKIAKTTQIWASDALQSPTRGLLFDGNNDRVSIAAGGITELDNAATFSVAFWVLDFDPTATEYFFTKNIDSTNTIRVLFTSSRLYFYVGTGSALPYGYVSVTGLLDDNMWHHITCAYNGGGATQADKMQVYVDGVLQTLTFSGTALPATTTDLSAAVTYWGYTASALLGYLTDCRIYSSQLNATQANTLFREGPWGTGYTTNMVHQWKLQEGTGTTATDTGSNPKNGTIAGATWTVMTGLNSIGMTGTGFSKGTLGLPAGYTTSSAGIWFGTDVNLYRSAADTLKTDDSFTVGGTAVIGSLAGVLLGTTGTVSAIAAGTANQVRGMNAAANGYEYKTVAGTANRVTVTHTANTITLTAPQDLHTAATPTFAQVTAKLTPPAGTTAAGTAPLKFTSGSLLTAAEAGAVEFLTDKFYGTITTGAARKEFTLNDAALTSGRVPYATTNGRLVDGAGLTFDGTNLTATAMSAGGFSATGMVVGAVVFVGTAGALMPTPSAPSNLLWNNSTQTLTVGSAISFLGESSRSISIQDSTGGTAGGELDLAAGSSASGSTDTNGGNVHISAGGATGSGGSSIVFAVATPGASGTTRRSSTNSVFISPYARIGVGSALSSPTASVHIRAGSADASSAPLKFTTGTLMSTAEQGAFEYVDASGLYFTFSGPTRKEFMFVDDAITEIPVTRIWAGSGTKPSWSGTGIHTDTTTGANIGSGATNKIGFWGATPVVQPAHVADATGAGDVVAQLNTLIARLEGCGILASS